MAREATTMKLDLHSRDIKLVEKKKFWFGIPAIVLVIAIIAGVIWGVATGGDVLNLGMDFTGGYSLTVKMGTTLDDDDYRADAEAKIIDIIENPNEYYTEREIVGLEVRNITKQGSGQDTSLYVRFTTDRYNYQTMTGTDQEDGLIDILSDVIQDELFSEDYYSGSVTAGDSVSATVSSELLVTCICGILMSLALMLIYVAFRFELLSGAVAILCLVHDVIMMFLFMMVFHIEITSTFVAALITILGYSINNTIIIFDKIRDNLKVYPPEATPSKIANDAVRDTIVRSANTTGTTMITVVMVAIMAAIFGVTDLINFCLPLIAGLVAGTFSSVLIAPSLWATWKTKHLRKAAAAPQTETLPPAGDDFFAGMEPTGAADDVRTSDAESPEADGTDEVTAQDGATESEPSAAEPEAGEADGGNEEPKEETGGAPAEINEQTETDEESPDTGNGN